MEESQETHSSRMEIFTWFLRNGRYNPNTDGVKQQSWWSMEPSGGTHTLRSPKHVYLLYLPRLGKY
jgi:hypothetical protein